MKWKVGAYLRISHSIEEDSETNSLDNQKLLIEYFVKDNPHLQIEDYYVDNGYSGTNFNRPEFKRLLTDVKSGKINCIIVKDISRFGRNYAWVQIYLGEEFPALGTRFISINEKIDSWDNPNYMDKLEFSLLALLYEQYAIESSIKVKDIKRMQQKNGEYLGVSAPYGYIKDAKNGHILLIDEYASKIVKRIFDMTLQCKSRSEIADILNKEKIDTPSKYKAEVIKVTSKSTKIAEKWNADMVRDILKNEIYIGNMVQGKIMKPIRRLNKRVKTKKEDWIVVENTHEAIISKDNFESVQRILEFSPTMLTPDDLLLRYLKCSDCKNVFHKKKTKYNEYYYCKTYYRTKECSKHSIIKSILENMVLEDLKDNVDKKIKLLTSEIVDKYIKTIYIFENSEIRIEYK